MTNPADTTTILSPPTGTGDSMDETLVTQSDGTTLAKRPRVVIGLDDGRIVAPEDAPALPVEDREQLVLLHRIADSLDRIELMLASTIGA